MVICAKCGIFSCYTGELDKVPANCPMRLCPEVYDRASAVYKESKSSGNIACLSARVESAGYRVWPRLREIMEFSRLAGFKRLGLPFCVGLRREALEVTKIFENNGFEVVSLICKTGSRPKEELGLLDQEKVRPGRHEPMCNPIAQAMMLNKLKTDLTVLLGRCVGHDTLFISYSDAPITVLDVIDRVTGNNPLESVDATHYFETQLKLT